MASRLNLHEELCTLLGSRNVYFQPPESVRLSYPCIVYRLSAVDTVSANNRNYKTDKRYEITVIDRNPDSDLSDKILEHFQKCQFDRAFVSDNLNHWSHLLYY